MSEDAAIPKWGDDLAHRLVAVEDRLDALEGAGAAVHAIALEKAKVSSDAAAAQSQQDGEVERRKQELVMAEHEFQVVQARLADVSQRADAAEQRALDNQRRADASAARFAERETALQVEADALARTRRVIERIWPRFLLTPPFADWKTGLETALLSDAPSSAAALLFANLHGYTACLLENDQKYLRDGLRDISRFLYTWLKETGHPEREAFEVALAWAAAFNEECAGKCELEVPEPGTPVNALSMTFPPRGSSPEVASVRTWCVRDAQRRVIHRAEVFT